MELLNQIWTAWNEQWGATVATILGIIAIAMNIGDKLHRLVSAVASWKGWTIAPRCYQFCQRKYRMHRAKSAMFACIKQVSMTIGIRTYNNCLAANWLTSERNQLNAITPEKPSWLNDYFVATALEALHSEGKIAKAELYELSNSWPPSKETYFFISPKPGKTIEEQANKAETDSRCRAEQFPIWRSLSSCSEESRFDISEHAETTEPGSTTFHTRVVPKPNAPPCRRCWERKRREEDITRLVDSITKYDLANKATIEITGRNQEFQEAVTEVLIESDCTADASTVREIVAHAITIRSNQMDALPTGEKWTEQLTADFKSSLNAHVRAKSE